MFIFTTVHDMNSTAKQLTRCHVKGLQFVAEFRLCIAASS